MAVVYHINFVRQEVLLRKVLMKIRTVGTTEILTPVKTSTSVSNSHGLVISVVIEAGSQPI